MNTQKKTVFGLSIAALAVGLIAGGAARAQPYGQNLNGAYDARGSYTSLDRGNATATGPNTGRTDALGQPASFDRADDGSLAALFAGQNAAGQNAAAQDAAAKPAPTGDSPAEAARKTPSPSAAKSDATPKSPPTPK